VMVALNLSCAIKDGPDGCLIGADGVQGYRSSVVRSEKNASVFNGEIKSSLHVRRLLRIDKHSETGEINSTQKPVPRRLADVARFWTTTRCKVGSGFGIAIRIPKTEGERSQENTWQKKNIKYIYIYK
jgi:hypothetical protein